MPKSVCHMPTPGNELSNPVIISTEDFDPRYRQFDTWPTANALHSMWESQLSAVATIGAVLPQVVEAVEAAANALKHDGRLVYVGAGASGRLAVQDGSELYPTFNWPHERTCYVIAGGLDALVKSAEGAEDIAEDGISEIEELAVGAGDVVIGVAASGRTPFTVAAIEAARQRGAVTIGVSNVINSTLSESAEYPIEIPTGAEVIAGSTRMKAGTVQKVILNLLSTQVMTQLNRIYEGLMVDMVAANEKLRKRAVRMVEQITGCSQQTARQSLEQVDWNIKSAALVAMGCDVEDVAFLIEKYEGSLRRAIASLRSR